MENKASNNIRKIIIIFIFVTFLSYCVSSIAYAEGVPKGLPEDLRNTRIPLGTPEADTRCNTNCSSKIFRAMARVYMADGNYAKAQSLAEDALTLACEKDSYIVKRLLNDSSVVERLRSSSRKTSNVLRDDRRNTSDETSFATDDRSTLDEISKCLIDLAFLYKNQGKFSKAQTVGELGLELQKKIYYKYHPYIASTLRILSSIYQSQAKYELAEETLSEAICIMRKTHLSDDPALAPFQVDMARLLMAQGKLQEAEAIYIPAIDVINKSYGPDHLYTAGVLESLAELYTLQAKYEEASTLIEKTLAIQKGAYGSEHYLMIPSWLTKAEICQANGDYDQAENLMKTALKTSEKYLGAEHPTTEKILSRLGKLYAMKLLENKQVKVS